MWARYDHSKSQKFHWVVPRLIYSTPCGQFWLAESSVISTSKPLVVCKRCETWVEKNAKAKAKRCITHHNACDCREYRMQEMEAALKDLAAWGKYWSDGNMSAEVRKHCMKQIQNRAMQGLIKEENHV